MTIQIHGKERMIMIYTDGEKCNVMESDGEHISTWFGTATICKEEKAPKEKSIETIERYGKDGKLVEKIVREIVDDGKGSPCIVPMESNINISPYEIVSINQAEQCERKTKEYALHAPGRCDRAVVSVSNGLPSGSYS